MTRTEHLLTCVAEECLEVAQRATKALRFGLSEVQPGQPLNNAQRIAEELIDLFAVLRMLEAEDGVRLLPGVSVITYDSAAQAGMEAKMSKVESFLRLSHSCGTLDSR